jgi:predicted nucleic acid-binding protein
MSTPTVLFIDTNIFDELSYNFDSEKMKSFIKESRMKGVTLLLPDPVIREVQRHIEMRSLEVISALRGAERKAPFLKKWEAWPFHGHESMLKQKLRTMAQTEWSNFLLNFKVINLDYSSIDLKQIMNWYDTQKAPFGEGAKRKEFPDAFTFASMLDYIDKNKCMVAIVSMDSDFRKASIGHSNIVYFASLPAYTAALISGDSRVKMIQTNIAKVNEILAMKITEEFPDRGFYPAVDPDGSVEDVKCQEVIINDTKVISIGDKEATISFKAEVNFSAFVRYDDPDTAVDAGEGVYISLHVKAGSVSESVDVTGILKVDVNDQWTSIEKCGYFEIEEDDIEVVTEPEGFEDYADQEE